MKRTPFINKLLIAVLFALLFTSCERDEEAQPVACFSYFPSNDIKPGDDITFTNCSTDGLSYLWDFGDDDTSMSKNPKHDYSEAGDYDVTLIVTNKKLKDQITKKITISSNLSGTWNKTLYINDTRYNGILVLEQDGDDLSGSFEFSDGSGHTNLLPSSSTNGNSVTIAWMLDTYKCTFPGTLNADNDYMSGNWSSNGTPMGAWSATKQLKNGNINILNSDISEKERFIELMKK